MATRAQQAIAISNAKEKQVYGLLMGDAEMVKEATQELKEACALIIDQTPEEKEHIRQLLLAADPVTMRTLGFCSQEEYDQAMKNLTP